jgi:hypothetical protein
LVRSVRESGVRVIIPTTTFKQYQEGEITPQHALDQIARQLDSLQDQIEPLQATEKILRQQASEITEALGGKADVDGFGTFTITAPSQTVSYDSKEMDRLVARLISQGDTGLAQMITNTRKEGSRAGSLRINRTKPGKE